MIKKPKQHSVLWPPCTRALSRKTFGWWAWRLDQQGRPAPVDPAAHFLPVEIAEVPDPDAGGVAAVEARIEIALPDGVRVRVGRGVDGEALRRVLAALGR